MKNWDDNIQNTVPAISPKNQEKWHETVSYNKKLCLTEEPNFLIKE